MTIGEDRRHALHTSLAGVLGPDEATTLMEYLPPVGWADVATKRDIDALGDRIRAEFSDKMSAHTRTVALAITGNTAVVAMLAFAAANL